MRRAAALAPLLLAGAACRGPEAGPFRDAPVVLVSIDTLRADRLPAYGYRAGATPSLDALAREGIVFESAWSHCPLTLPAHASLFTGLLPPRHGVRDNLGFTLGEQHRTLATRFRAAGLSTGGAVSAFVMRRATGIAQGFDVWDDALVVDASRQAIGAQQRDGAIAVESVARFVEAQGDRRFFAFVHLYEPHAPYAPPPQHRSRADPYDGEIAYADELVGRLFARLKARGLYDRSVIAVTSDHGEGLLDHGEQEHGLFLYREALQVPLLLRLPGGRRSGTRIAANVSQADLPATLLDLAGLPAGGMDGVSQRPALAGGAAVARAVYSETLYPRFHFGWSELHSLTDERYRLIRAPRPELYDMQRDRAERHDLAAKRASTVAALAARLEREVRPGAPPTPNAITDESRAALQALGYVSGGAVVPEGGTLPDPKDKLAVHEAYRKAAQANAEGRAAEAIAGLRAVVAEEPGLIDAWMALGTALVREGREADGVAAFEAVVGRDPDHAFAHLALSRIHSVAGRRDRAEEHARAAASREPGLGFEALALILLDRNRPAEAAAHARRSLAADPARGISRYVLAVEAQRSGRYAEAASLFAQAIAAQQREQGLTVRGLHAGLADCLARLGREEEAEVEFKAELAAIPHSREARVGLTLLYRSQGRDAEARQAIAGVVTANPRAGAEEYAVVIRTLAAIEDVGAARAWAIRARSLFPNDARFRP